MLEFRSPQKKIVILVQKELDINFSHSEPFERLRMLNTNLMSHLYLPVYTPIYTLGTTLCIGFVHMKNKYCELEFSNKIYEELKDLLLNGVSTDIKTPLTLSLIKANLLVSQIKKNYPNRGELFLEYLGNQFFTNEVKSCPILIFGVGAIGSTLTYLLTQFGFTNISVADFDFVEQSDILKTMVYDNNQKGMLKVDRPP